MTPNGWLATRISGPGARDEVNRSAVDDKAQLEGVDRRRPERFLQAPLVAVGEIKAPEAALSVRRSMARVVHRLNQPSVDPA